MNLLFKNIPIYLLFFLLLSACGDKQSAENVTEKSVDSSDVATASDEKKITFSLEQFKLADIKTGIVEMRNLSSVIKLNGMIEAEPGSMATVSAPLGGYVKTPGLLPGDEIKKGQVLAVLENSEFIAMQQDYLESKSRMTYLEQELQRQQKLRVDEVNAVKTLQQVESDFKVMQAKINGLEQRLALAGINTKTLDNGKITRTANLYAPISGFIKSSNVNIGRYVNPTDVLFEIVNKNNLHLALNAFEKDLPKIALGQNVKFSLANENNYNRTAKIVLIGKSTGSDGMISVYCHFIQKGNTDFVPGMYAKAWIETGTQKQYAVPSDAVVQLEGKDYLILQTDSLGKDYTFKLVEIKKGIEQEGYTAVTLPETFDSKKSKVVVKNAYSILSAMKNAEEEE